MEQIIFILVLVAALAILSYSFKRVFQYLKLCKPYKIDGFGKRMAMTMDVVFAQSKIFRMPVIGLLHALVFWGFLIIASMTIEMVIDGIFGIEKSLAVLGRFYNFLTASAEFFAVIIMVAIVVFLVRRIFLKIKRFSGKEMSHKSHKDAIISLMLIFFLMLTLVAMNLFYVLHQDKIEQDLVGCYPVSVFLSDFLFTASKSETMHLAYKSNWWAHILTILFFANYLPHSKHFHVFMSIPNVFLSRLQPLGKLDTMENVKNEVKLMLDPNAPAPENQVVERFGVLDIQDVNWKNYLDSLACTQCGRCTNSCPANITGKQLSPRKVIMSLRQRMKEKSAGLLKDKQYSDNKSLIRDLITEEELWACTTCNACAQECPININHPTLIVEMRRYLVMEESAAPAEINAVFQNIENNGAPWQFPAADRMLWAENIKINDQIVTVPIISEMIAAGKQPEYLLWVSSAGAIDDRFKKVMKEFIKILTHLKINYATLGLEESDSGDVARRTGNEMLFQMQAMTNVELLKNYNVTKIITCDPHDYNTLKNEYPDFGGNFEVWHHSQFLSMLIDNGTLKLGTKKFEKEKITFHDPCYLGRANKEYKAPRNILYHTGAEVVEMKRNKSFALCCGAGGGQMFKEAEKGDKEIFIERIEDAIQTSATIIATACPFCMTMMTDGIKYKNKEEKMKNLDLAELVSLSLNL